MVRALRLLNFSVPIILVLLAWEMASRTGMINPRLLPSLTDSLSAMYQMAVHGTLLDHALVSIYRQSTGFLMASFFGITAGIVMASYRSAEVTLAPLIKTLYPLPKSALIPLFILWLGIGDASKIAAVFLGCLLPAVITTYNAARGVNIGVVWSAWSLGTPRWQIPWKIVLPAIMPDILSGLRIGLALSFTLMVSAEFLIGDRGLGTVISNMGELGDYSRMFGAVLTVTLIGLIFDRLFLWLRNWLLRWMDN